MIGQPPINRLAQGLLGFLDIKSMGKNPTHLGETVAGTISLEPFYALNSNATNFGRLGAPAAPVVNTFEPLIASAYNKLGTPLPDEVPSNECWLVTNWAVGCTAAAGNQPQVLPSWVDASGYGQVVPFADASSVPALSSDAVVLEPFLLPPGARIGIQVRYAPIGATIGSTIRLLRFQL